MNKILIFLIIILLSSCTLFKSDETIIGKWIGFNSEDGIIEFKENGVLLIFDKNGKSVFSKEEIKNISYEAINEVIPHQIYLNMSENGKTEIIPFGIYKIENDKLIIRDPIEYHRTLGGFDMGVSRYEIPKDFNGFVRVFKKVK